MDLGSYLGKVEIAFRFMMVHRNTSLEKGHAVAQETAIKKLKLKAILASLII